MIIWFLHTYVPYSTAFDSNYDVLNSHNKKSLVAVCNTNKTNFQKQFWNNLQKKTEKCFVLWSLTASLLKWSSNWILFYYSMKRWRVKLYKELILYSRPWKAISFQIKSIFYKEVFWTVILKFSNTDYEAFVTIR